MTNLEFSVEVETPPERVWEVASDPRNLPRWDRHIASVRVPEGGLGPGVRYEVVMRFMALRATVGAEVVEWEPPRHAVVRLSGLIEGTVTTSISALPLERSLLRHEVSFRFHGPLGGIGARSVQAIGGSQLALRHGVLAQKADIEAR